MDMRKIGRQISVRMGFTMSAALSLLGTTFGQATSPMGIQFPGIIIGIIVSFIASLIISLVIGFIVPMKAVGDKVCMLAKTSTNSIKGRVLSALASDLIYTPIITFVMVALARTMTLKNAPMAQLPPYIIMVLPSLVLCFIVGWFIIFFVQPIFMKNVLKKNGIEL